MLQVSASIIETTLNHIRAGGLKHCETAVLWLGKRAEPDMTVVEVYKPLQIVDRDFFKIPTEGMRTLLAHLKEKRLQIIAQVHSHPDEAFHSKADDEWAIVRHQGALSLVIPKFGAITTFQSFANDIASFQLDATDVWRPVHTADVLRIA
jgi:proteasome lid subunit RPN8/RPN11